MNKRSIFFIVLFHVIFTVGSHAQSVVRSLRFDTIGWMVNVPLEFEILEVADEQKIQARGKKILEESTDFVADVSKVINLFSAKSAEMNYFAATIEPFEDDYAEWKENNQFVKEVVLKSFKNKMPDVVIDTLSSKASIDGIEFLKFTMIIKLKGKFLLNWTGYWHLYKGFDFSITYVCTSDKWVKELDKCILESKLKR